MREVESWQTKRQVATTIQRMPVRIGAVPAAGGALGKACSGQATLSHGVSAAAETRGVMQDSKK